MHHRNRDPAVWDRGTETPVQWIDFFIFIFSSLLNLSYITSWLQFSSLFSSPPSASLLPLFPSPPPPLLRKEQVFSGEGIETGSHLEGCEIGSEGVSWIGRSRCSALWSYLIENSYMESQIIFLTHAIYKNKFKKIIFEKQVSILVEHIRFSGLLRWIYK